MTERRSELFRRIAGIVGESTIQIEDVGDGWPSRAQIRVGDTLIPVDCFVGPITLSHRNRDDRERRFQNPLVGGVPRGEPAGKAIVIAPGRVPLLLGLWEERGRPLLVSADPVHRAGNATRYSVFVPLTLLVQAESDLWHEQTNTDGEVMTAFDPKLLPVLLSAVGTGTRLFTDEMSPIIDAAGQLQEEPSVERARRAAYQLVRRKEFSREVCLAYDQECAMCGFDFSLVVGAHIYPASAPNSEDRVWNGLALCHNHHAAFDAHRIWVHPESRQIRVHPALVSEASRNSACAAFVTSTFPNLRSPKGEEVAPRSSMFEMRYGYFPGKYDWT